MEFYQFIHTSESLDNKKVVFLLDDFVGTGKQATDTWFEKFEDCGDMGYNDVFKKNRHLQFIYLVLVGLKEGREYIEKNTPMRVILGEELDER